MRLSFCLLSLALATGCAAVNTPSHPTAYEQATFGRPGWLRLQADGSRPWIVFVCESPRRCAFVGLFQSGQVARIRWRTGDQVMVSDGARLVQTPEADGRVLDRDTCSGAFRGEVRVTVGMRGDSEPVRVRRFRAPNATDDMSCRHEYFLVEAER